MKKLLLATAMVLGPLAAQAQGMWTGSCQCITSGNVYTGSGSYCCSNTLVTGPAGPDSAHKVLAQAQAALDSEHYHFREIFTEDNSITLERKEVFVQNNQWVYDWNTIGVYKDAGAAGTEMARLVALSLQRAHTPIVDFDAMGKQQ